MKKPKRDRHSLDVSKAIVKTYQPKAARKAKTAGWAKPQKPGAAAKTVLVKTMRTKKKP